MGKRHAAGPDDTIRENKPGSRIHQAALPEEKKRASRNLRRIVTPREPRTRKEKPLLDVLADAIIQRGRIALAKLPTRKREPLLL